MFLLITYLYIFKKCTNIFINKIFIYFVKIILKIYKYLDQKKKKILIIFLNILNILIIKIFLFFKKYFEYFN